MTHFNPMQDMPDVVAAVAEADAKLAAQGLRLLGVTVGRRLYPTFVLQGLNGPMLVKFPEYEELSPEQRASWEPKSL